jgi:superfamily I DNA/RNA helicase
MQIGNCSVPENFTPTSEQKRMIQYNQSGAGHLLIRGESGSGKTHVLAARAGYLQSDLFDGKLLFLAYNSALIAYFKKLLEEFDCTNNVEVFTVSGWARELYRRAHGVRPQTVSSEKREELIERAKQNHSSNFNGNHLATVDKGFWVEEVKWILGSNIKTHDDYKQTSRGGRGTAIPVRGDDCDFIWAVYETYRQYLREMRQFDSEDIAGIVTAALPLNSNGKRHISEELKYEHICVDEVQDCHLSWLAIMVPFAKHSLTLAGDLGQRIYRRNFTWRDAGVEVVGHSHSLTGSFRTTKQIMQVAVYLARNEDVQGEDYVKPTIPKDQNAPKVRLLKRSQWWEAREGAVQEAAKLWRDRDDPSERIVVAAQFDDTAGKLQRALSDQGIPAKFIKQEELAAVENCVIVTTFHQLKGLEFDHVVIAGLEDETMPQYWIEHQHYSERPEETEHYSRRLVYVAMTRAKRTVVLAGGTPFCRFFDDVPNNLYEII